MTVSNARAAVQHLEGEASASVGTRGDVIERTVQGLGFDLIDVARTSGGLLRVTIDRRPGQHYDTGPGEAVLVDDCERVTRQLQVVLEVEGIDYRRLEVSSPGLDRPLRSAADWQRFVGSPVEITLRQPFDGRKHWRGLLMAGSDAASWRLLLDDEAGRAKPPPSRTQQRKADKARAQAEAAGQPLPSDTVPALDFTLEEVREARLVPVIDFKGRSGPGSDDASSDASGRAAQPQEEDGGPR